ncbi:hypothetical protein GQ37_000470 [Janthinobacterium sp. BJB1]|uniref:hypothetical protein n=1 Tax=Janthinobacterium sp. GW458P TaxID=1981504 RepID=UPI000A3267CC|nr:hypothetical protein [Janthinobacterium sp. GW458P]MBE3025816.1 hypothetical protein [Janthinobacterium sp. GW458P]PHV14705.1 hypothetical protein CSQ90_22470 [Janthinobacterium sp. BJB303]PJD00144.1 hypothetical protein GQ37_000470 [Janthinobacterium sp. BJB1]
MSSPALETYLARLYTDDAVRDAFLLEPRAQALLHGLSPQEADALAAMDRVGLRLAAASYGAKRAARGTLEKPAQRWWRRLLPVRR